MQFLHAQRLSHKLLLPLLLASLVIIGSVLAVVSYSRNHRSSRRA